MRGVKIGCIIIFLALSSEPGWSSLALGPWIPLFQGVDLARGTNSPDSSTPIPVIQVAIVARIDLTDPNIAFFTTPRITNYLAEFRETAATTVSNFLTTYGLQLAMNANFYDIDMTSIDPPEGTPKEVYGLSISRGTVVSKQENSSFAASLLFTTNNRPIFVMTNSPPGTNTLGIYTAITGNYPLLINGRTNNVPSSARTSRAAYGISQDSRYLYLFTLDFNDLLGSEGAAPAEVVYWMQQIGAYNAINTDGGGSTTLDAADYPGHISALNTPQNSGAQGRERRVASHFGVYAKPLLSPITNLVVSLWNTTATLAWDTTVPLTAQIAYGTNGGYQSLSASNSILLRKHVVTLNGLRPVTRYYFQLTCTDQSTAYTFFSQFTTPSFLDTATRRTIFGFTNSWKYATNNLDGINWQSRSFDDSSWFGPGPGLFYIENNKAIGPQSTGLPPTGGIVITGAPVMPTYYFRTHFKFEGDLAEPILLYFTNYIDDGAVFYLNGTRIKRIRLSSTVPITYTTTANGAGCDANPNCFDAFMVTGAVTTNVLSDGNPLAVVFSDDNLLAVEVHQVSSSDDVLFGTALAYNPTVYPPLKLHIITEGDTTTIYWNGTGFTLQQADDPRGPWTDVSGPVTTSMYLLDRVTGTRFFNLRK
jgi:Phosphodiester glycosidase